MSVAETFILDTAINLAVFGDMELRLSTQYIAREGDHNSATFRIVRQPAALDSLACRAEIETQAGKNYYLVANGEFQLTQDISVPGPGRMQLVYSDGVDVMRKTSIAHFTVMPSINAVDPSDPDFSDGLAQLQAAAFASVIGTDTGATFYNLSGQAAGILVYPPGQGGGVDEAQGNLLWLRRDGVNRMTGSIQFDLANGARGIIFDPDNNGGIFYSTGTLLVLRRPTGDADIVVEPSNGSPIGRSPIMTQLMGDGRYLTPDGANLAYVRKSGDQMAGPLIAAPGSGVTNVGIGIGDNATGFYRIGTTLVVATSGDLAMQILASQREIMCVYGINAAANRITNVADATTGGDAVSRSFGDARYLQPAVGGIVTGPLQIMQTPVVANDAANKSYVDNAALKAPVILREVQGNIDVSQSGNWVALTTPITFNNPRADSTVMCVTCMINATTANVASANVRLNSQGTTLAERRGFIYGAQGSGGFTVTFFRTIVGPAVGPFSVEIQSIGSPPADFTVIGGIADGPRSQIAVYEVGAPA